MIILPMLAALAACDGEENHDAAKALIACNCAACHTVPGVPSAVGKVGPSLKGVAIRQVIAGKFANSKPVMVRWIMHPQQLVPGTAMPEMGLTQVQAMQIADYLFTLDKP
jgi:cytochrome c2